MTSKKTLYVLYCGTNGNYYRYTNYTKAVELMRKLMRMNYFCDITVVEPKKNDKVKQLSFLENN